MCISSSVTPRESIPPLSSVLLTFLTWYCLGVPNVVDSQKFYGTYVVDAFRY